jgi:acetyl esterase/lipase
MRTDRTRTVLWLILLWAVPGLAADGSPGRRLSVGGSDEAEAAVRQTYVYKTVGDCRIHADVFRPADKQARPVILWLHGGALIWGSRTRIRPEQLARYVREGFVVVAIDYRLAPETQLPAILDDLKDAYEWIRTRGPTLFQADPDRIIVVGHSAGGYLALMAGSILSPPPRALVSFYGYGDIGGAWCNQPDAYYSRQPAVSKEAAGEAIGSVVLSEALHEKRWPFYLYCRQQGRWVQEVVGGQAAIERFCPIRHVTGAFPPTLLLHGNQDTDVPYDQSVRMAEELQRKGVPCELVTLTERGHAFDSLGDGMKDPPVADAFERVIRFVKTPITPSTNHHSP